MSVSPASGRALPRKQTLSPSPSPLRQACDACRLRKRRCSLITGAGVATTAATTASTSPAGPSPPQQQPPPQTDCDNCERTGSRCTFLIPLRPRGPRPGRTTALAQQHGQHSGQVVAWRVDMAADDDDEEVQEEGQTPAERRHSTDELLPRELILTILDDYVRYVYPLLPVVHCPTFAEELSEGRDADDEELLALIVSLCAATVCLLPSRLAIYRTQGLPFTTRTAMANHCWSLYQDLRKGPAYFDTVSHTKWAASYMLAIAFHQTGNANLWRMLDVESMQLLRLLDVHRPESYINLDPIQVQLRKKAFCLVFNGCVHHAYNLATERLSFLDLAVLRDINLDDLLPLPLDDDYISHTGVLPCPPDIAGASVTAGFILNVSVFAAALESSAPTAAALILCCSGCTGTCARAGNDGLDARIAALRRHHHRNRYMLDSIIPAYRSWGHRPDSFSQTPNQDTTAAIQRDAIRANIHATHLWLQSMLLDQIDAAADTATIATPASTASSPPETQATTPALASWDEREDICRQLLHIIHSTPSLSLEANGSALVYKVRDIAASLVACPFPAHEDRGRRAAEYVREFSTLLTRLDGSEIPNSLSLRSWVDTTSQRRRNGAT